MYNRPSIRPGKIQSTREQDSNLGDISRVTLSSLHTHTSHQLSPDSALLYNIYPTSILSFPLLSLNYFPIYPGEVGGFIRNYIFINSKQTLPSPILLRFTQKIDGVNIVITINTKYILLEVLECHV